MKMCTNRIKQGLPRLMNGIHRNDLHLFTDIILAGQSQQLRTKGGIHLALFQGGGQRLLQSRRQQLKFLMIFYPFQQRFQGQLLGALPAIERVIIDTGQKTARLIIESNFQPHRRGKTSQQGRDHRIGQVLKSPALTGLLQ